MEGSKETKIYHVSSTDIHENKCFVYIISFSSWNKVVLEIKYSHFIDEQIEVSKPQSKRVIGVFPYSHLRTQVDKISAVFNNMASKFGIVISSQEKT